SPSSSASQATLKGKSEKVKGKSVSSTSFCLLPFTFCLSASQEASRVVFPKPAGAEIRVNLRCRLSFSCSIRRGRRTTFGRGGGIYSFVVKIGVGIQQL